MQLLHEFCVWLSDTAFVRNPNSHKWHKYDDSEVYEMAKSDIKVSPLGVLSL